MAEQLANFGNTTLAEDLDDSETGVDVTSGAVFPASGNFRVNCEDEIMLVTSRSTNTLTVTRGAEGTAAAVHSSGTAIKMVLTAAGLANIIDEVATLATDTSVGTETFDISRATAGTHDLLLTGNPTFTLSGAFTDKATDMRIILRQDGTGSRTVTWPGSVSWVKGSAPVLQTAASAVDTIGLLTVDAGTTWLGYYGNEFDNPMTTAGDIIYGGVSGVPTRLAKGDDTQVLTLASGVPSWAAATGGSGLGTGTSFPGSPTTGDRYRRSNLDYLVFFYDGTRWVSEQIFALDLQSGLTATSTTTPAQQVPLPADLPIWLVKWDIIMYGNAAATWTITLQQINFDNTSASLATKSVDIPGANNWLNFTETIGAVVDATANSGSEPAAVRSLYTEVSGSAIVTMGSRVHYRYIAT